VNKQSEKEIKKQVCFMTKFFLDEHMCSIQTSSIPWFVRVVFWKKWATAFECSTNELRDVQLTRRAGILTLVISTNRKRVPVYMGVNKKEAKRITNALMEKCYKNEL
jgi:hypothetical protein